MVDSSRYYKPLLPLSLFKNYSMGRPSNTKAKYVRYCLTCDPKRKLNESALKETAGCCNTCNTTNEYFACPNCDAVKDRQNTMYYHMSKCTGSTEHVCTHCDFITVQKRTLELHIQAKHPEEADDIPKQEEFCCPMKDCKYSSLTAGNLRVHFMRIHLGDMCKESMERTDNNKYCCTLCAKEYSNSTHFFYHIGPCLIEYKQVNILQQKLIKKVL